MALAGPRLKVLRPLTLAVTGADLDLRVDGRPAPRWQALTLAPGQVVECRGPKDGARAIMAVAGGLAARPLLGSASVYILGCLGAPLAKGQRLRAWPARGGPELGPAPENLAPSPGRSLTLRAVPGPNQDFFTEAGLATLFASEFKVSPQADRRGVRLSGPAIELRPGGPSSIVSEPNTPGIVQVPPGGAPIILLNEQTVGGYAKAATVIGPDRGLLAAALPGDSLRFVAVSAREAVAVARTRARELDLLRQAVRPC
jgi:allophanate hydrolase subunit 2